MVAYALRSTHSNETLSPAPDAAAGEPGTRERVLRGFLVKAGALTPAAAAERTFAFYAARAAPWRGGAA